MLQILRLSLLGIHFLLASVVALLVCLCRPFNPDNTRLAARIYSRPAMRLLGLSLLADDVKSMSDRQGEFVVIANHQSNYDLFVMGGAVPSRTVTVGKESLKWVPLFGQVYWLAGNVLIDRSNPIRAKQAMQITSEALTRNDTSIWIFPEGTRNRGKGLLPFKRGAFQIAIDAGVPIIPLCFSTYTRHMRLNRWHSGTVMLRALPAIDTAGLTRDDISAVIERCHAQMQECIAAMDSEIEANTATAAAAPVHPETRTPNRA